MRFSGSIGGIALALMIGCAAVTAVTAVSTVCATGVCAMKAYWKLDESLLLPRDATGNGYDGTPTGSLHLSADVPVTGFVNPYSFSFNGTSSFAVSRPVQDDFTICAWIKTSAAGAGVGTEHYISMAIAHAETAFIADDFGFGVDAAGTLTFGNGDGGSDYGVHGTTVVNTGNWIHACATRAKTSGSMRVYVNGVSEGSGSGSTTSLSDNPTMTIGYGTDGGQYWNGLLDDIRVYDAVLTPAEIADIANGVDACFVDAASASSSDSPAQPHQPAGGGRRGGPGRGGSASSLDSARRVSEDLHAAPPQQGSSSSEDPAPSSLKARTCERVMRSFSGNATMLARVNERLEKRLGFRCGG